MAGRARRQFVCAIFAALVVAAGALTQAEAASFSVTNTSASGAGSLAQAITDANNAGGADTITFAPDVTGTITAANLAITGPTTITGPGAASLTVKTRFTIDTTATATISGLTIDGGDVSSGNVSPGSATGSPGIPNGNGASATAGNSTGGNADGGAVNNAGELVLERVVVTGSEGFAGSAGSASGQGGAGGNGTGSAVTGPGGSGTSGSGKAGAVRGLGIFNAGSMIIRDTTVTGNSGTAGDGGDANAIGGQGGTGGSGAVGTAPGGAGGAGASTGASGGDVRGAGVYNAGTMTIVTSTITGNSATGGSGGDAHAVGGTGGTGLGFSGGAGGSATATGGAGGDALGAGVFNAGTLELLNSTISGNSATAGGTPGTATATNGGFGGGTPGPGGQATATPGRAGIAGGGGLQNETSGSASATLRSVTFATNRADLGANLRSTGTLTITNSIIANPTTGPNCDGAITSGGFNIDSGTSCGFAQTADQSSTDPQLGLLQDNGGPTATHAPAQTSPAIDRGSSTGLTTDQRGLPRPSDFAGIANTAGGDGADIGAVELTAPSVTEQLTVDVATSKKEKGTKLRASVTCSKDCEIDARGKGKAGGEKFKTKSTKIALHAGVATTVKLKLKKGDRRDVAGEKGKATIVVAATSGDESATDSAKVRLKP